MNKRIVHKKKDTQMALKHTERWSNESYNDMQFFYLSDWQKLKTSTTHLVDLWEASPLLCTMVTEFKVAKLQHLEVWQ